MLLMLIYLVISFFPPSSFFLTLNIILSYNRFYFTFCQIYYRKINVNSCCLFHEIRICNQIGLCLRVNLLSLITYRSINVMDGHRHLKTIIFCTWTFDVVLTHFSQFKCFSVFFLTITLFTLLVQVNCSTNCSSVS